jgi:hypothetical protein
MSFPCSLVVIWKARELTLRCGEVVISLGMGLPGTGASGRLVR